MKHLDLSYIKTNVTNDEDFIRDLLGVFLESLETDLAAFDESMAEQDHGRIKRSAHKLKSSFRSLGMDTLSALAQAIENMGTEKEPIESIVIKYAELKALVPEMKEDVAAYLNGHQ